MLCKSRPGRTLDALVAFTFLEVYQITERWMELCQRVGPKVVQEHLITKKGFGRGRIQQNDSPFRFGSIPENIPSCSIRQHHSITCYLTVLMSRETKLARSLDRHVGTVHEGSLMLSFTMPEVEDGTYSRAFLNACCIRCCSFRCSVVSGSDFQISDTLSPGTSVMRTKHRKPFLTQGLA